MRNMEVPCFRCFFMENLKARGCKPEDCEALLERLFRETGLRAAAAQPVTSQKA
jgi:hypothetical protein